MERTFADKSNGVFRQIIFIITVIVGLLSFLIFLISQKAYLYIGILIHKIETACGCDQMNQLISMHPFIFGALFVLSLFITVFISRAVYKFVKLIVQTRKFSAYYLARAKFQHSSKLRQVIADMYLDGKRIVEVRDASPVVFCFGLWNPKICISNGLIKILQREELEAVLLHEVSHMSAKEPIKLFIIKLFYGIFFFLPGLKTYVNKYVTFSELAADERATNNFTERSKLARAIYKISQAEERRAFRSELALSFFTSTIAERVNKLSDNNYMPKFQIWGGRFLLGLLSVIFIASSVVALLADSAKAFAMHNNGGRALNFVSSQCVAPACGLNNERQICGQNGATHQHLQSCNMER